MASATVTNVKNTITVDGVVPESDYIDELLPKGTLILVCCSDCNKGKDGTCVVKGLSGNVIFASHNSVGAWWDHIILPHDQKGFYIPTFLPVPEAESDKILYFIRPDGRVI